MHAFMEFNLSRSGIRAVWVLFNILSFVFVVKPNSEYMKKFPRMKTRTYTTIHDNNTTGSHSQKKTFYATMQAFCYVSFFLIVTN